MSKLIKISDEAASMLDTLKHEGQSYDGIIKEICRGKIAPQQLPMSQRTQNVQKGSGFHPVPKPSKNKKEKN